ncbi:hypothetical protein MJG53_000945 [Ovis ammon polii x Ovis aries]|uniref:Uncharacterized protein n=1 Tax=Ovis ammon polii x Ovis aries TaxID=2918886 RepID=A0ACB9VKB0_9CETA|nr:hypothetical protein MJT46_000440 [Ovis ammon polii x Ovis aries]KAI4589896.1 hypothetical protein MJG53_000945 [Ovis ammon polii x Ovis aries]
MFPPCQRLCNTCTYRDTRKKLCNSVGAQCEVGEETKQNWICCQKTLVSNYSSARNSLSDVEQNHLSGLSLLNCVKADSSPAEPPGKPKNTGMHSLSLLQWTFPTQELNRGLLHCRWILYQLSYQGSPLSSAIV